MKKIWSASAIVSAMLIIGASCAAPRLPPRPPKPPKPPRPPHGPNAMEQQQTITEMTIAYPHK